MAGLGLELRSSYSSSRNNTSLAMLCYPPGTQGSSYCTSPLSAAFYLINLGLTFPSTEATAAKLQVSNYLLQGQSPECFQY